MMESEDNSDTNETFHDAEMIPDKVHAPMPLSPLSPRRTRVSSPNLSSNTPPQEPTRIGCEWYYLDDRDDRAVLPIGAGLGWGDRTSANFGTFRTAMTVVTSAAALELYRGDSSSMALSVSESSC